MTLNSLIKAVKNLSSHIHVEVLNGEVRVSGNTYPVKGNLKLLGFRWDQRRREWYYLMQETDLDEHEFKFFTN